MMLLSIKETVSGLFYSICEGISWVIGSIIDLLPSNPFSDITVPPEVSNTLGYLNYFLPIKAAIIVIALWLGAIAAILIYKLLYSFFKLVGS